VLPDKAENTPPAADSAHDARMGPRPLATWRFRLAVLRHDKLVYRFACSMLRDEREAEDVTQETFLRYWQVGADVEAPRQWLLRVARNACLDRLRHKQRFLSSESGVFPEPEEERDPAWHYEHDELSARLQGLVAALPEPQRSLVVLFDVQGVDARTCAGVLGLSVNQVKVYLHRARRRLRAKLELR
jgi:RNA polymerase sigma-70 factor, ECF subfamily